MRNGGRILVDQLELNGVDLAFCLPGESFLPVLDALYDSSIRLVSCRHEQGAANAAEAYGKLTGRPGICLVTRGPGATQAAVGVHTAKQDSTPLLLLVGHVPRAFEGREAWQELDYARAFGGIAKAAWHVDRADRLPEHLERAFSLALSGRPGPVVLALPEDVLVEEADVADAAPVRPALSSPRDEDLARLRELLAAAERPLVIVGEGGWTRRDGGGRARLLRGERAAGGLRVPLPGLRRQPLSLVRRRPRRRDGRPAGDAAPRGGSRARVRRPARGGADAPLHAPRRAGACGRRSFMSTRTRTSSASSTARTCRSPAACPSSRPHCGSRSRSSPGGWSGRRRRVPTTRRTSGTSRWKGPVDLGEVMAFLRTRLPGDAIQTCGAGNFTVWAHRFAEFTQYGTQVCPRSGSMGYGVAAAIAAKLVHPDRIAVCFTGDGDFVMSSPEFATAVQYELPIIVLLVNNGMFGTIRMHQERQFPGRVVGTDLVNPDFVALAQSYGGFGERVERTADFEAAFERALGSGLPALLELPVDPERISPRIRLSELQGQAG